jgi:hypothetical protein
MPTCFVKPDHQYDSYVDFWSLVELSNYHIVSPNDIEDRSDVTYIHTWFTARFADWTKCKARHIAWILEWIQPDRVDEFPKGAEIWTSDRWYAKQINAKYILFGSHPGLQPDRIARHQGTPWDIAAMMYLSPRRGAIFQQMIQKGLTIAPNSWGMERHEALSNSQLMIHIHQHDHISTIAPQRFAIAAAWSLPMVSETIEDPGEYAGKMLVSDYGHFAAFAHQWAGGPVNGRLSDFGRTLHQFLCIDRPFGREVEAAL